MDLPYGFSNNSTPRRDQCEPVFNPFHLSSEHELHRDSSGAVLLSSSGKVICPKCLEQSSLDRLDEVDTSVFDRYALNLFEGLDEHCEDDQLRKIALPVLEIMLKRRSITIRSDQEFHNIIKVIYKIMKSDKFNIYEFAHISVIFSTISVAINRSDAMPFLSIWQVSQHMLEYGKRQLSRIHSNWDDNISPEFLRFYEKLSATIKTYLHLLGQFSLDKIPDMIFPLFKNDSQTSHCRRKYFEGQKACLDFMKEELIPHCWHWISSLDRPLNNQEANMIQEIFLALRLSLQCAIRCKNQLFLKYLSTIDCLKPAHRITYQNQSLVIRKAIKAFVKEYVKYYITLEFGTDDRFERMFNSYDLVEMNSQNAICFSSDSNRYMKSIFYLMVNCIAHKQKSKFYNPLKIRTLLKSANPSRLRISESKVAMRSYMYFVSMLFPSIESTETIGPFVLETWERIKTTRNYKSFSELFCFNEQVFSWTIKHQVSHRLIRIETMEYIVENTKGKSEFLSFFKRLLEEPSFSKVSSMYFERSREAIVAITELIEMSKKPNTMTESESILHKECISRLSASLPAQLQISIIRLLTEPEKAIFKSRAKRLALMIVNMIENCENFVLMLDEQFIKDLFSVLGNIYDSSNVDHEEEFLIVMNEFISSILSSNNPDTMTILKYLDFYVMGYMFSQISDYKNGHRLGESIAKLFVAYDNLDYPINQDISVKLYPMANSALNWMMSSNEDLHVLSLRLCQKVMGYHNDSTTRVGLATGLIHMIFVNPQVCKNFVNLCMLDKIVFTEEFLYHPMRDRIMDELPICIRFKIDRKLAGYIGSDDDTLRAPSPPLSFSSAGSDHFAEEHATIQNIITGWNDDNESNNGDYPGCRVPNSLFVAMSLQSEEWPVANPDEWERQAREISSEFSMMK